MVVVVSAGDGVAGQSLDPEGKAVAVVVELAAVVDVDDPR